jgi:hypothetical protein
MPVKLINRLKHEYEEHGKGKIAIGTIFFIIILCFISFGAGYFLGFQQATDYCITAAEKLLHIEFKEGVIQEIEARFGKVLEILNE